MKKIMTLFVLGLLVSGTAGATAKVAISTFVSDELVEMSIKNISATIQTIHGPGVKVDRDKPTAALLQSSCGFAGCFSTYLVTQGLTPETVNAQTVVVGANVEVIDDSGKVIKVLDPSRISRIHEETQK